MSSTPVVPVAGTPAPAQKQNAIQLIEQELVGFFKQKEQAVANVHAIDGAIQATTHLLGKLKAEAAKAEAEAKEALAAVEGEAGKVIEFVKKEL